jgi:hypothetical protein
MKEQETMRKLLVRQREYFEYLFEQEQRRAANIVGGAKVYIAFLVFVLSSLLLKVIDPKTLVALFTGSSIGSPLRIILISLVLAATVALSAAVLFTISVLKVWYYDRLCDPIERFRETLSMEDELQVLSKSICDFAVATGRNNRINNMRATYLARGLNCLLTGLLLSLIALFTLNLAV